MNPNKNPFQMDQEINIDESALDIMKELKKLQQSPSLGQNRSIAEGSNISFCSQSINQSRKPNRIKNEQSAYSFSEKRENPIKIYSLVNKRVKLESDQEDNQSQFIGAFASRKVSIDEKKHESQPIGLEVQRKNILQNPKIVKLQERNERKRKQLEQLKQKISRESKVYQQSVYNEEKSKLSLRSQFYALLNQRYKLKIYYYTLGVVEEANGNSLDLKAKVRENLNKRLDLLKEGIKKPKGKNQESNSYLEQYTDDHQDYMKEWKKKLEDEKRALSREIERQSHNLVFIPADQKYHDLPSFFLDEERNHQILQEDYVPLYSKQSPDSLCSGSTLHLLAFNLRKFQEENMTILSYPKLMKIEKRMNMKTHFQNLFQVSHKLTQGRGHRIFTPVTYFGMVPEPQMLFFCHESWDGVKPIVNLTELLSYYESFGEAFGKYVTKVLLRAHQESRMKLKRDLIILPQNIYFDQKNQIRIEDWLINETFRFEDFGESMKQDSLYLYFPPEYQSQVCIKEVPSPGVWTVAVILYEIVFGKKPFEFSPNMMDFELFYALNELSFPEKPNVSEKCKDFLKCCLVKQENRIDVGEALKHAYFDCRK